MQIIYEPEEGEEPDGGFAGDEIDEAAMVDGNEAPPTPPGTPATPHTPENAARAVRTVRGQAATPGYPPP